MKKKLAQEDVLNIVGQFGYIDQLFDKSEYTDGVESVILLGHTRSGKSTLANYLIDRALVAKPPFPESYKLIIDLQENQENSPIGHKHGSKTTLPNKFISNKNNPIIYWDCPGFGDTKGSMQDIVNSYSIQKLFGQPQFKILLVVTIKDLEPGGLFINITGKLGEMAEDVGSLIPALSLVITKAGARVSSKVVGAQIKRVCNDESIKLTDNQRKILEHFSDNIEKIGIFHKPKDEGIIDNKDKNSILSIINNTVLIDSMKIRPPITDDSKLDIRDLAIVVSDQISQVLNSLTVEIKEKALTETASILLLIEQLNSYRLAKQFVSSEILKTIKLVISDENKDIQIKPVLTLSEENNACDLAVSVTVITNKINYLRFFIETDPTIVNTIRITEWELLIRQYVNTLNGQITLTAKQISVKLANNPQCSESDITKLIALTPTLQALDLELADKLLKQATVCSIRYKYFDAAKLCINTILESPSLNINCVVDSEQEANLLHVAARHGNMEIAEYIIKLAKNEKDILTSIDKEKNTPLQNAVIAGDPNLVELLVNQEPHSINIPNVTNKKPLDLALQTKNIKITEFLLTTEATMQQDQSSPLCFAVKKGYVAAIEFLISTGATSTLVKDKEGNTPLHLAILGGNIQIVQLLVNQDFNCIKITNGQNNLPFQVAAKLGHTDLTKLLIKKESDMDGNKGSLLHYIIRKGYIDTIGVLLQDYDIMSNINVREGNKTALDLATANGYASICNLLSSKGARKTYDNPLDEAVANNDAAVAANIIKSQHDEELPALHIASIKGYTAAFKLLAQSGHDVTLVFKGWTALHYAAANGHVEIIRYLLEQCPQKHTININNKNIIGCTLVHEAAYWQQFGVIKYLFEECSRRQEIDFYAINNGGTTALDFAKDHLKDYLQSQLRGRGTQDYEASEWDYCSEYTASAFEKLINLRLKSADVQIDKDIYVVQPFTMWHESNAADFTKILVEKINIFTSNNSIIFAPINLYGEHWIGLVIDKNRNGFNLHFMDSEQQDIPTLLKESLEKTLITSYPGYCVNTSETKVELQRYNNCGPEVVENFIQYVTHHRLSQEDAVPVHALLYEDSILLAGEGN